MPQRSTIWARFCGFSALRTMELIWSHRARLHFRSADLLLLDEPTASLDAANRAVVVDLIAQKKHQGVAMVAIVHDDAIRQLIADRVVDVTLFAATA
jgi:alpha-D-ribose 1-methylphosphonate 5-triphosphate synthase subunit PhnL